MTMSNDVDAIPTAASSSSKLLFVTFWPMPIGTETSLWHPPLPTPADSQSKRRKGFILPKWMCSATVTVDYHTKRKKV